MWKAGLDSIRLFDANANLQCIIDQSVSQAGNSEWSQPMSGANGDRPAMEEGEELVVLRTVLLGLFDYSCPICLYFTFTA